MEFKRVENVKFSYLYKTNCLECDKPIELWFNGGELDTRECCGLIYSLESPQIDFVIDKPLNQTMR